MTFDLAQSNQVESDIHQQEDRGKEKYGAYVWRFQLQPNRNRLQQPYSHSRYGGMKTCCSDSCRAVKPAAILPVLACPLTH